MRYKNTSRIKKKFRGVEFKPGETKTVNGFINDPLMIRVDEPEVVSKKKTSTDSTATATTSAAGTNSEVKKNG